ncbi:PREDICTED: meprin A subunit alpha-like [Poecilia mexicana]|uniref:meprin A subunit alpha-like n=1 Tax=Poecilia mexicana TaxID=48701 RepID=UPI00072E00C0|nr:PREDICTED: meprin A subunit alpha-like [Poecilia mexicana]
MFLFNMGPEGRLKKIAVLIGVFAILKVQAAPTITDDEADAGELGDDILEINRGLTHLFEGDIAVNPKRNAILDQTRRWKFPIPYILTDSLDLNAKGVILQAFEEYRLRSCVDFKPYEGESTYISFVKLSGCWSYVGDDGTGQNVSIGARCDTKAIVQHELLHALGFYHEQSRSDRDDYVKIWWDEIEEGKGHNFNKYEDDFITDLNTPYDYESIMHYRPFSFNKNESIPTITTTIPYFNDVIGQRLDFSEVDITRLNRMYDCAETHTLLDQCSFELINICGMIQNEDDNTDWVQTLSSPSDGDHTLEGRCRDSGYFMKFDTSSGAVGSTALLESRILYPKRSEQCLQFFYKMTGAAGDNLVIWIRSDDGTGAVNTIRKIHTITGDGDDAWKIAHVNLKMSKKFRYIFQGIRGSAGSSGAILIDDITLTETVCPSLVWQIRNFTGVLATTPVGTSVRSKCVYNAEGYSFGVSVYPNGRESEYPDYIGATLHLCSGENDGVMQWPAENRQATIVALDQDPDVTLRMSSTRSFTSDNNTRWDKPTATSDAVWDESCRCYRGQDYGWSTFISHNQLQRRSFLKNDDLIITADFNDLTHLIKTEVPVERSIQGRGLPDKKEGHEVEMKQEAPKHRKPRAADPCHPNFCLNGGVCVEAGGKALCRCATTQTTFYSGPRCEEMKIDRGILGALIGGAAGTVVLTLAIFTVIRRSHTNPF